MASLAPTSRIIKTLSPKIVSKALAEWLLVQGGFAVDSKCCVTTKFSFDHADNRFKECRVELEIL